MKKIIIATGSLGGGGAERVFLNLANEMVNQGAEVHILVTSEREVTPYKTDSRVIIDSAISTKKNKALKVIDKYRKIRSYLKKHKDFSVISFFADVSAYCTLASLGLGINVVVSERNDPHFSPKKKIKKALRIVAFSLAKVCVFQTEDARQYFPRNIKKKGIIISNPLKTANLPESRSLADRENTIILIGRFTEQKNFLMMMKAWEKLNKEFPNYKVEIYGNIDFEGGSYGRTLEKYSNDHQLNESMHFMGFSNEIYEKINKSKIYVSTSIYEGISNTMLEAMAIGTPTIATDCPIGGARATIRNNDNGILVPIDDIDALTEAIKVLITDQELWEKLHNNGMKLRDDLDISKISEKWLELL